MSPFSLYTGATQWARYSLFTEWYVKIMGICGFYENLFGKIDQSYTFLTKDLQWFVFLQLWIKINLIVRKSSLDYWKGGGHHESKKYRIIAKVILVVVIVINLLPLRFVDGYSIRKEVFLSMVFLFILYLMLRFFSLRCPFCKERLSSKLSHRFCPRCGMRYDENTSKQEVVWNIDSSSI